MRIVVLGLSAFVVMALSLVSYPEHEAFALQWTTLLQSNVSVRPNSSLIDSAGNIDVTTQIGANVFQFTGTLPSVLRHSVTIGNGCTQMNRGQFLDSSNRLWVSCGAGGIIAELDGSSLGVLNTTSPSATCCNALFMIGNVLYAEGSSNNIWTYFISGSNIIKCGTNAGQCSTPFNTAGLNTCTQTQGLYPDFAHNVAYMDCLNPAVSIYKVGLPALTDVTHWSKTGGNPAVGASTSQNIIAYDAFDNAIWSAEGGSTLQEYNPTGGTIRAITIASGSTLNPVVVGNTVTFLDLSHSIVWQYFTNGTNVSSNYFGNIVVTPLTSAGSLAVSSNNVAIIGSEANAGSSTIFLGSIATGSTSNLNGGGTVCVNTAPLGSGGQNIVCWGVCDSSGIANVACSPNGKPSGSNGGALTTLRGASNVTSSFANILCGVGLDSICNNGNAQTNGVGYLIIIFLLVLFVGGLAMVTRDDSGRIHLAEVHPAIWIAGMIAITGAPFLFHVSDGVPFFGSLVGVAAFAAIKFVRGL